MTILGMSVQPQQGFKVKQRFSYNEAIVPQTNLWIPFHFQMNQMRDLMLKRPCQIVLADMVVMRRRLALEVRYQSFKLGHRCGHFVRHVITFCRCLDRLQRT